MKIRISKTMTLAFTLSTLLFFPLTSFAKSGGGGPGHHQGGNSPGPGFHHGNPPGPKGGPGAGPGYHHGNPPGPAGGPGAGHHYGNPPGPKGGPGAGPAWKDNPNKIDNPPGPIGGQGTDWGNPPGPAGGPGTDWEKARAKEMFKERYGNNPSGPAGGPGAWSGFGQSSQTQPQSQGDSSESATKQ